MAYENIILENDGKVSLITINRPQSLNALNAKTISELSGAISELSGVISELSGVISELSGVIPGLSGAISELIERESSIICVFSCTVVVHSSLALFAFSQRDGRERTFNPD